MRCRNIFKLYSEQRIIYYDAIQSLALQKKVKALRLEDYWLDFGKPEDIPRVENFYEKFDIMRCLI